MKFEHVLVVGAGQMGGGMAQVVAASGRRVSLHDPYPGAVERGLEAMRRSLTKLNADVDKTLARIEAVTEDPEAKQALFRRADEVLPASAILASNTSSIPITSLAAMTNRPEQ